MNFQNQLRKNFLTFSIKLIFIVFILFVSTTLIINLVEKNIYKIESINYLDNTFRELNTKIFNQMGNHNSNLEYLESVKNKTVDKKLVSTNNYAFSQSMNLRY
ncbi:MAG: hypothetical protein PQJ49_05635 [Sphaerochaetaceae bacterium]|nr:hypothetical protein [Sphaerochaetaceae bacterium]